MKATITSKPVLQGTGTVLFRQDEQVAVIHQCIGGRAWSVRVAGGRFEMTSAQRYLAGGRKYDSLTYVDSEDAAIILACSVLDRQRKHVALPAIFQTGVHDETGDCRCTTVR